MRRVRDDGRPFISSQDEQSGLVQMVTASNGQSLTRTDALSYLESVKNTFQDCRGKHDEFLKIMKDFMAQRISRRSVIMRVKELFKEHEQLLLGFNIFLPKGFDISLPMKDQSFQKTRPINFDEAVNFLYKVKTRFQGADHMYNAFLDILNTSTSGNKPRLEVFHEVSVLFHGHDDLLVEFRYILGDISVPLALLGNQFSLSAEIKVMSEEMLLSIGAGYRQAIKSNLDELEVTNACMDPIFVPNLDDVNLSEKEGNRKRHVS